MTVFKNKVAVVTGAGSGIGKALAKKSASLGMHVVLADIDEIALSETENEIKNISACPGFLSVKTDVSLYEDLQKLARQTIARYGKVHLLFNNAGVILDKKLSEYEIEDWNWILGVDLYGVIHGIKTFIPIMEAQNEDAHIVNTASLAGFVSSPTVGAYKVAKHGVVALTEILYYELSLKKSPIHVSLLAPSWCNTSIRDSEQHRPQRFEPADSAVSTTMEQEHVRDQEVRLRMAHGIEPRHLAEITFDAICTDRFYIFSDDAEARERIGARLQTIIETKNPAIIPNTPA